MKSGAVKDDKPCPYMRDGVHRPPMLHGENCAACGKPAGAGQNDKCTCGPGITEPWENPCPVHDGQTPTPSAQPEAVVPEKPNDGFAPSPPDKTYQHALVRRLWEAQLLELPADVKRLMAEAATELEGHLPATDAFVDSMRRKHAKVLR
jgi:hypothetical protein